MRPVRRVKTYSSTVRDLFLYFKNPRTQHQEEYPYDYTVEVRNRFKGIDLIDRVPEELWTEVHGIVQEAGI